MHSTQVHRLKTGSLGQVAGRVQGLLPVKIGLMQQRVKRPEHQVPPDGNSRVQSARSSFAAGSPLPDTVADASKGYRFLIWATIVGANIAALSIFYPPLLAAMGLAAEHQQLLDNNFFLSILGSAWAAFGLTSILALRAPTRFAPLYVAQMVYKAIWLVVTALPLLLSGASVPAGRLAVIAIWVAYVAMDVMFIPWKYVLATDK